MKKYLKDSTNHTNDVTKVLIMAFFILALMYGAYKFGKYFSFQSPILLRSPFKRVYMYENSRSIEPLPTSVPRKDNGKERQILPSPTATPKLKTMTTDQTIADYISSKDWDYSIAIRIAKSENAWNWTKHFDCSRTGGRNSNGTYDHGLWQINDIHIRSGAITLEDANDCFKSTDFAYGLYKSHGNSFTSWSAYNNLSYLGHNEVIY